MIDEVSVLTFLTCPLHRWQLDQGAENLQGSNLTSLFPDMIMLARWYTELC